MGLPKTASTFALLTSWLKTCWTEPVAAGCAIFSSIILVSPSSLQKRRYTQGDCQSGQHDSENSARGSVLDRQPALRLPLLNLNGSRSIPVQSAARPAQFHCSCQGDDPPIAGCDGFSPGCIDLQNGFSYCWFHAFSLTLPCQKRATVVSITLPSYHIAMHHIASFYILASQSVSQMKRRFTAPFA